MPALLLTLLVALASSVVATPVEAAHWTRSSLTMHEAPTNPLPLQVLIDDDPWDEDERDDTEQATSKLALARTTDVESLIAVTHAVAPCKTFDGRSVQLYRLLNLRF